MTTFITIGLVHHAGPTYFLLENGSWGGPLCGTPRKRFISKAWALRAAEELGLAEAFPQRRVALFGEDGEAPAATVPPENIFP